MSGFIINNTYKKSKMDILLKKNEEQTRFNKYITRLLKQQQQVNC
jgi:hypothetical protein